MEAMPTNLVQLAAAVPDEATAYAFMETLRWGPDRQVCPHCASVGGHWFLKPANGVSRQTRTGKATERRVWRCRDCRKQFSVLTGSVMHRTKVPVRTWLFVLFEMVSSKNGVAAREVERKYGLTPKAAWFLTHRIREAMKHPAEGLFTGTVESDETWVGGRLHKGWRGINKTENKTPVVTLIERESGEARSQVVERVNAENVWRVLHANVDPSARLMTDRSNVYPTFSRYFASHERVDHEKKEYARGEAYVNSAEGFFSQLKRSLDGTHHHVDREHLHRYVAEFDFRYSTRKMADAQRFQRLAERTGGKRLTYRESSSEPDASSLVA